MDPVLIMPAIIGASATAISGAANIAANQANATKGNLSATFEVFNGTSYPLVPVLSLHRHGALFGGVEGEFHETPGEIDPRKVDVFSVQNPAGTDTIGLVLYQCSIFDLIIGWHLFDQGRIKRYLTAVLYPKDYALNKLPTTSSDWGAFFSGPSLWPNNLIWSGTAKSSDDAIRSSALRVHGKYVRGEVETVGYGATKLDSNGEPVIVQKFMYGTGGNVNFSSVAYGAAKTMKVYVSDTGRLDIAAGPNMTTTTQTVDAEEKKLVPGMADIELPPS